MFMNDLSWYLLYICLMSLAMLRSIKLCQDSSISSTCALLRLCRFRTWLSRLGDFRHQNGSWNRQTALSAPASYYRAYRIVYDMKANVHRLLHARPIIASSCFWQVDGTWPKWIFKFLERSFQCRCLPHTRQEYNKIRNSYCHQLFFFTGDCTSDVSSRCSVFISQQFLQNYETNQPVTTLCTSHFSCTPPQKKKTTACLTPLVL